MFVIVLSTYAVLRRQKPSPARPRPNNASVAGSDTEVAANVTCVPFKSKAPENCSYTVSELDSDPEIDEKSTAVPVVPPLAEIHR